MRRYVPGLRHWRDDLNRRLDATPRRRILARPRLRAERRLIARRIGAYLSIGGDPGPPPWPRG